MQKIWSFCQIWQWVWVWKWGIRFWQWPCAAATQPCGHWEPWNWGPLAHRRSPRPLRKCWWWSTRVLNSGWSTRGLRLLEVYQPFHPSWLCCWFWWVPVWIAKTLSIFLWIRVLQAVSDIGAGGRHSGGDQLLCLGATEEDRAPG